MSKVVFYPGPAVPPDQYDVEQIHHVAGLRIRRGPNTIEDEAIADQLVASGLFTANATKESRTAAPDRICRVPGSSCSVEAPEFRDATPEHLALLTGPPAGASIVDEAAPKKVSRTKERE